MSFSSKKYTIYLCISLSISKKDIEYFLVSANIDGRLCSSIYMHACAHNSRYKEQQTRAIVSICVRTEWWGWQRGREQLWRSVLGSWAEREGRGGTRRRQMTPVARPPRSVHPRPYTRCSTVLFLRVLAYAHKHIYTRDAVAYARTLGRGVCAYIRTDSTS